MKKIFLRLMPDVCSFPFQTWLYKALLNGNFSGQSDGIIDNCTDIVRDYSSANYFPFNELDNSLQTKFKRITDVNLNIIDSNTYLILNLLYLYNKEVVNFDPVLTGNTPEIDHIFPKSKMLRTYKCSSSLINNIGNYMILEKSLNINKTNKLPEDYFPEPLKEQDGFYQRHEIPNDPRLYKPENFEIFVNERRKLIFDTIKKILVYVEQEAVEYTPTAQQDRQNGQSQLQEF